MTTTQPLPHLSRLRWRGSWLRAAALLGLGLGLLGAAQAATPAGAIISNTATATYHDERVGADETITSNTVTVTVAPVEGIALVPDLSVFVAPGDQAAFAHTLSNTGNIAEVIALNFQPTADDDFDLSALRLFVDSNGNGRVDAGERELANGETLSLTVGQSVALVLVGSAPAVVANDIRAVQTLNASTVGGARAAITDTAITRVNGALQLTKRIDNPLAQAGDTVRYTLTATNTGGTPVPPTTVTVDGTLRPLVLIRDTIPANTVFAGVAQTAGGTALYHVFGQALQIYSTVAPSDSGQVDAIAFGYPGVAAGAQLEPAFSVKISDIAGGRITNIAEAYASDPTGTEIVRPSNPVSIDLPLPPGEINYYNNDNLGTVIGATRAGAPLFIGAFAAVCNTNPGVAESYPITLSTQLSGDTETGFQATETAPNSGIFVLTGVPTQLWPQSAQVSNDRIVQAGENDVVTAALVCNGNRLSTRIVVAPSGIVYDSRTNVPVGGATVEIFAVGAGQGSVLATVHDLNGDLSPNPVVTGQDGRYEFPQLAPGTYRIVVTPPGGYRFPSEFPPAQQPLGRRIGDGSYGRDFTLSAGNGAVTLDLPLDPHAAAGSFALEKTASESSIELGETLRYTLRLRNNNAFALSQVRVQDVLPRGFRYVKGSVRYNRGAAAEPSGAPGPALTFVVGNVAPAQVFEITYLATAGVGAAGKSINTAQAFSDQAVTNTATAAVDIDPGVFRDEALILGKVFVDCDRSRQQDPEELGIPGVRLYLDDGTFAITDAEGKYSFYGISPRSHVLKVDALTLPKGAELETTQNRNGGDPHSLFIDLKKGELHRADFAEGSCSADIVEQVKQRRAKGEVFGGEINKRLDLPLNLDTLQLDARAQPAAGIIDENGRASAYSPLLYDKPASTLELGPRGSSRNAPSLSLENLLPKLDDNQFAFMDLHDGDTLATRDVSVRLVGRIGAEFKLFVNGDAVPNSRVGQKAILQARDLQAWEYISVRLQPGVNKLRAEAVDGFGNPRGVAEITVIAPGDLGKLQLVVPPSGVVADGQTPGHIVVRLLDEHGVKVTARTPVTLETNLGRWDVEDLDAQQAGIQTFIEGGEALFDLIPLAEPGEARVRVSSGRLKDEQKVPFLPYLRPLIASGIVEGAFAFQKLKADSLQPVTSQDGFEQDIKEINFGGGSSQGGVRGSVFLKGKVKGDLLLTLAYDSDKNTKDRLFRDIDPEAFYPVYGDSGIKGFDAQSTSKLYVRVDKGRSYLLYGDFNSNGNYLTGGNGYDSAHGDGQALERRLSNYSRSLTGARYHGENEHGSINLFASYDRRRQQVSEFRGEGISGPYPLHVTGFVRNSEKIEILTRDRVQTSTIINTVALTRFSDYSINELDGTILFRRPVPSVDENLNPIFVRITFELDTGGDRFWVYGADGQYKLTDFLEVGAAVARDDDPGNHYRLYGVNANIKLDDNTYATAEAARSDDALRGTGNAYRGEVVHKSNRAEARVFYGQTDAAFENPNAALTAGRQEAGFKGIYKLSDTLRLGGEGIYSNDRSAQLSARKGVLGYLQYQLGAQFVVEGGLRRAVGEESGTVGGVATTREINTTSARGKLTYTPDFLSKASLFGEYEQDLTKSLREAALGGDYQISSRSRIYARHEFISSLNGIYNLSENGRDQNSTVFGLDYDYTDNGSVFSEYRVRDALSGSDAEAALGLRNTWSLLKDLRLSTTFERIQPLSAEAQETVAATVGAEYRINPLTKAAARLEYRTSRSEDSVLNTLALARKLDLDWTVLAKNTISWSDRGSQGLLVRDRARLGFAYRDTDTNRWLWLGRYEARLDRDEGQDTRRLAHVISTNVNYQPSKPWIWSGRWASKFVDENFTELNTRSSAHLVSGRVTYDVTEKIDLGLIASNLFSGSFASHQYGVGAEAGYLLTTNLWFSAGYNLYGFHDTDLGGEDYTRQGPFIRLRFKFDEDLFKFLE